MNPALLALLGARVKAASTITDTFNRADSTTSLGTADTGQTWTRVMSPVYGIMSNLAYKVSGSPGGVDPALLLFGSADMAVSADLSGVTSTSWPMIWARVSMPSGDGYRVETNGTRFYLERFKGAYTALTDVAWTAGRVTLAVATIDATTVRLTLSVDGVVKATYNDTSASRITTGSYGGFSSSVGEARFNNFSITAP